jgi:hypothetical protein
LQGKIDKAIADAKAAAQAGDEPKREKCVDCISKLIDQKSGVDTIGDAFCELYKDHVKGQP